MASRGSANAWSALGNFAQQWATGYQADKARREERLARIREQVSLRNAESPEQMRIIPERETPGRGLPANVAGPGQMEPEQVERYRRQYRYNDERGEYEGYDEPISREANEWADTGTDIKAAGGQLLTTRTQRDRAGRERSTSELSPVAPKLTKTTIKDGDTIRDVMIDAQGNEVRELGRGPRYKPGGPAANGEAISARDNARADNTRRVNADKQVAARLAAFDNSDAPDAILAKFKVKDRESLRDALRKQAYADFQVGGAPAPSAGRSQLGEFKKPIPPELQAEIAALIKAKATRKEIAEMLQDEGYL